MTLEYEDIAKLGKVLDLADALERTMEEGPWVSSPAVGFPGNYMIYKAGDAPVALLPFDRGDTVDGILMMRKLIRPLLDLAKAAYGNEEYVGPCPAMVKALKEISEVKL